MRKVARHVWVFIVALLVILGSVPAFGHWSGVYLETTWWNRDPQNNVTWGGGWSTSHVSDMDDAVAKGVYRVIGAQEIEVSASWWWMTSYGGDWSIDQPVNEAGTIVIRGKISYIDHHGNDRVSWSAEKSV